MMEEHTVYKRIVMFSLLSYISYTTAYSIPYIDTIDSGVGETEADYVDLLHRLRREAVDPDIVTEPPITDQPNTDPSSSDHGSFYSDTGRYDATGSHGDSGSYDSSSYHGDIGSHPGGFYSDIGSHVPAGNHGDTQGRRYHGYTGYPNTEAPYSPNNEMQYPPAMHTDGTTHDYHNPLIMTRPGEPPPMALPMTQDGEQPVALPLTHEELPPGDPQYDTMGHDTQGGDPQGKDSPGDPPVKDTDQPQALAMTGENQDAPVAMAQRQGPGQGQKTLKLPPHKAPGQRAPPKGQGRGQGQSQPTGGSQWPARQPGGPRDTGPPERRPNGPRDFGPPERRPGGPRDIGPPRDRGPGSQGHDILATAAILDSDVHDTMVDGMKMMATNRAIESLSRGGAHDRPPPDWGPARDSGPGSAPRRSGSGQGDMLDTITKMHVMKNQADIVQDHVDTVGDIHRDRYDYGYRRDFYDPYYRHDYPYDRHRDRYRNQDQRRFPTDQNFDARPSASPVKHGYRRPYPSNAPPYDRYPPPRHWGGDGGDDEGFGPGYSIDIHTGLPCTNMSDPKCRMSMGREIQIETPYGEMDMEPGELDLEGPAAAHLLKMLRVNTGAVHASHQEITLNHEVLGALQRRFGVNTTQGIRRMSTNPDFQAFMYRVLTHSTPITPGEYVANLTKAEVDTLLVNLDGSQRRLQTTNLDHAKLNYPNNTQKAGSATTKNATIPDVVLTIDGGPVPNTGQILDNKFWVPLSPMGGPGFLSNPAIPLSLAQTAGQGGETAQAGQGGETAQAGTVAAFVSHMLGMDGAAGGEQGEAREGQGQVTNGTTSVGGAGGAKPRENEQGEAKNTANTQSTNGTVAPATNPTGALVDNVNNTNPGVPASNSVNSVSAKAVGIPPVNAALNTKEQSIANPQAGAIPNSPEGTGSNSQGGVGSAVLVAAGANPPAASNTQPAGTGAHAQPTGTAAHATETDIAGKDGNKALSKDERTKANTWGQGTGANPGGAGAGVNGATGVNGAGTQPGVDGTIPIGLSEAGIAPGTTGQGGAGAGVNGATGVNGAGTQPGVDGIIPIGLSEAGIAPGATGQGQSPHLSPTAAQQSGYTASTAFAIAAIILIACTIILGPIVCMLCKAREKAVERKRKRNAMKNRDVGDNSIMEAMMLHEFGPEAPNFVANEAEAAMAAYKTEARYTPLKSDMTELAKLNTGERAGCLP